MGLILGPSESAVAPAGSHNLSSNNTTRIRILLWSRNSRDEVIKRLEAHLPDTLHGHLPGIVSILDELVKNAVKANHKHILIRDRIAEALIADGLDAAGVRNQVTDICEDTYNFNKFVAEHPAVLDNIGTDLSRILRQESVWLNLRNKNLRFVSQLSAEEKEKIRATEEYSRIHQRLKSHEFYVEIRTKRNDDLLWVEIINTAPILDSDLKRLQEKREIFKTHRENGTEYEFFMNQVDTSEGGSGFGYATIDTQLANMGLDPMDALFVISLHGTNAMLKLNFNQMTAAE